MQRAVVLAMLILSPLTPVDSLKRDRMGQNLVALVRARDVRLSSVYVEHQLDRYSFFHCIHEFQECRCQEMFQGFCGNEE
jgi:hypothetical protein